MNRALLLDRDGVINIERGYVYRISDFRFIDGIFDVCRLFVSKGYLIFVITNQSGIGRGLYNEHEFQILTEWMKKRFKREKIEITEVFFCPHHPTKAKGNYKIKCNCRKPNPGMILEAKEKYDLDLKNSVLIGGSQRDIIAGEKAGVGTNILVDKSNLREVLNYSFS